MDSYVVLSEIERILSLCYSLESKANLLEDIQQFSDLIGSFTSLRRWIHRSADTFDPKRMMSPFLNIISCKDTNGELTLLSLSSIHTILSRIEINSIDTISDIIEAVSHCQFPSTTDETDEIVLFHILRVLALIQQLQHGLSDESVWRIVDTYYGLCFSLQVSSLLHELACHQLHDFIILIFQTYETAESYGIPCIIKVFGFLCQKTRMTQGRELAFTLKCVKAAISNSTCTDDILSLIKDDVCSSILTHARPLEPNSTEIVLISLDIIRILWHSCIRHVLKMQFEAMVNSVFIFALTLIVEGKSTPPIEILECLMDLLSDSSFLIDLYVNYDCDDKSSSIVENLFTLLSKVVFSTEQQGPEYDHMRSISLETCSTAIWTMYQRYTSKTRFNTAGCMIGFEKAKELWKQREIKSILKKGTVLFNEKPSKGFRFLHENGLLKYQSSSIAQFLRSLPEGMDKTKVGEYLGTIGTSNPREITDSIEFHEQVLRDYVCSFSFRGHSLIESLRMFLSSFRLPGEAQQIDRILNAYASEVHEECNDKALFATVDVAYLLSFSIIMLNTDLHNPNIKMEKKMSRTDFHKNNVNYGQEVSNGYDLPLDYLDSIYSSIQTEEIRTSNDDSSEVTSDRWKDMLYQAENDPKSSNLIITTRTDVEHHDIHIYKLLWRPLIDAFSFILETSIEEHELHIACNGYVLCAAVGSHVMIENDEFNIIFRELCVKTTLLENKQEAAVHIKQDAISAFSVNMSAQLATIAVCTLVSTCAQTLNSSGWHAYILCLARLHEFKVLPCDFFVSKQYDFVTAAERQVFMTKIREQMDIRETTSLPVASKSIFSSFSFFGSNTTTIAATGDSKEDGIQELIYGDLPDSKRPRRSSREYIINSLQPYSIERLIPSSASLRIDSFDAFVTTLCTLSESILHPKENEIRTVKGALLCEYILGEVIVYNHTRISMNIVKEHYTTLFTKLEPLIKGNLTVNGLLFDTASYMLNKSIMNLLHFNILHQTFELDWIVQLDSSLLVPQVPFILAALSKNAQYITTTEQLAQVLTLCKMDEQNPYIPSIFEGLSKDQILTIVLNNPITTTRLVQSVLQEHSAEFVPMLIEKCTNIEMFRTIAPVLELLVDNERETIKTFVLALQQEEWFTSDMIEITPRLFE